MTAAKACYHAGYHMVHYWGDLLGILQSVQGSFSSFCLDVSCSALGSSLQNLSQTCANIHFVDQHKDLTQISQLGWSAMPNKATRSRTQIASHFDQQHYHTSCCCRLWPPRMHEASAVLTRRLYFLNGGLLVFACRSVNHHCQFDAQTGGMQSSKFCDLNDTYAASTALEQ